MTQTEKREQLLQKKIVTIIAESSSRIVWARQEGVWKEEAVSNLLRSWVLGKKKIILTIGSNRKGETDKKNNCLLLIQKSNISTLIVWLKRKLRLLIWRLLIMKL